MVFSFVRVLIVFSFTKPVSANQTVCFVSNREMCDPRHNGGEGGLRYGKKETKFHDCG